MNARALGLLVAAGVVAVDQVSKAWALASLGDEVRTFTPLLDLVLRWNRGISFSFFAEASSYGHWALLAFTVGAIVALSVWLARTDHPLAAAAIGAILGGAVGNLVDRAWRGAVVDFLDLHFGAWHVFVFNGADAAISLGVVLLAFEALRAPAMDSPE